METLFNSPVEHHPLVLLAVALVMQWLAAYLGNYLGKRREPADVSEREDLNDILGATMSLLALIISFGRLARVRGRTALPDAPVSRSTRRYRARVCERGRNVMPARIAQLDDAIPHEQARHQ